jgi:hypothetical protein
LHPAGALGLGKIGLRIGAPFDVNEELFAGTANPQYMECNVNSTLLPNFTATVLEAFFSESDVIVVACAKLSPSPRVRRTPTNSAPLIRTIFTWCPFQEFATYYAGTL